MFYNDIGKSKLKNKIRAANNENKITDKNASYTYV